MFIMGKKLDELDIKILTELQKDATISYKNLSKKIGAPESTIYDRTKRLKDLGIIKAILPLLDSRKCGKEITAYVRVSIKNISELGDIAKEIAKIDEVLEVHEISGEWDMLLKVKVENVKKLRDLEIEKIGRIDGIHGLYSLIAINTVKEDIRIKLD